MAEIYLLLGGNLGNRQKYLDDTRAMIQQLIGPVVKHSSIYETEPWGFLHETCFFNQVLQVESGLSPEELLKTIKTIEQNSGRVRSVGSYAARTMDIDILFYDDLVFTGHRLTIPHPRLHERKFTLVPLNEIAPDLIHPVLIKTIRQLLADCKDQMTVRQV
jgi:2-amino-4-hydroxy-6-hydroxymethyldihydropteridine diphosphokinase